MKAFFPAVLIAVSAGCSGDASDAAPLHDVRNLVTGEVNSVGMVMVRIPQGEFLMGSPSGEADRSNDENQVRATIPRDFELSAHEVTVGQGLQWLNDRATKFDSGWVAVDEDWCPVKRSGKQFLLRGGACKFGQSDDQPMVGISWHGATAFCEWLSNKEGRNYRLATEAE